MAVDASALVEAMRKGVPSFSPSPEHVEDGLTYFLINDLGRFICESALHNNWDGVNQGLTFLESLLSQDEPEIERLVGDCIWGLLDCPAFSEIRPLFGTRLKKLNARYPPSLSVLRQE
jgi:hypothetical protein